jgi:hypothetical protein
MDAEGCWRLASGVDAASAWPARKAESGGSKR